VNRKARSRRHTELAIKSAARRWNLTELGQFIEQLDSLPCTFPETDQLQVRISYYQLQFKLMVIVTKHYHQDTEQRVYVIRNNAACFYSGYAEER